MKLKDLVTLYKPKELKDLITLYGPMKLKGLITLQGPNQFENHLLRSKQPPPVEFWNLTLVGIENTRTRGHKQVR